ncbi:hypothetical protein ILUMI_20749 [Ignelater luminosus]|uniref:Uncharacterized protein n=1 Tax=Ignelater luminosus TaxID=2038154 RepID=A0A8K0G4A0_IGNLU|nr:hypothetical protein ILUMI_20749 [Ignelater luminosus]
MSSEISDSPARLSSSSASKPGGQIALSEEEEKIICSHLIAVSSFGFPINKRELLLVVVHGPGSIKVIVKQGAKHPKIIKNSTKASISILMHDNAAGVLTSEYVTQKTENVYHTWIEGGPSGTHLNSSKSC